MRKVRLPSGSELTIDLAPFADSKALYQALLEEAKGLKIDDNANIDSNFYKDIVCLGLSSKKIEAAMWKCLERCLYDGLKLDGNTFEPEKARDDYFTVMFEVTSENVRPFTKNLYAQLKQGFEMMQSALA